MTGLAAVVVVGGLIAFALGLFPTSKSGFDEIGDSNALATSIGRDDQEGAAAGTGIGEFEEFDPRLLPVQPLSAYTENKYWQEFFKSPDKRLQLVSYDVDLRTITGGGGDWISPQMPSLDRHAFLMGFSFVQRAAPRKNANSGEPSQDALGESLDRERWKEFNTKRWEEWFQNLDLEQLDEFERRDLLEAEQVAFEEILSKVPYGTPYTVVSDWMCRLGEYDFDRQVFPLVTGYADIDFGNVEIRANQQKALHVSEEDARELRAEGVTHICIRRTFQLEWGGGWFPFSLSPDSLALSPVKATELPSPVEWILSAPGSDMLALRRVGDGSVPSKEVFDAFSRVLREYHAAYMEQSVACYRPFSVLLRFKKTDADSYLDVISRLQAERDFAPLLELGSRREKVDAQFSLLNPSQELENLYAEYAEGAIAGEFFMMAKDPPAALDHLEPWLNSHLEMQERYDAVLAEIERLKGQ